MEQDMYQVEVYLADIKLNCLCTVMIDVKEKYLNVEIIRMVDDSKFIYQRQYPLTEEDVITGDVFIIGEAISLDTENTHDLISRLIECCMESVIERHNEIQGMI